MVHSIRTRVSWFPMPTFTFRIWLAGLAALVVVLALMSPAVRRGVPGTRLASYVLSVIMVLNAIGHLGGSMYLGRWLPGTTSAPLLLVASIFLVFQTYVRSRPGPPTGHAV